MEKITQRKDFDAVMSAGVMANTVHFALHANTNTAVTSFRIGAVVPKRWAKRAVTRNSIKRQIYNMAQSHQHIRSNLDVVIRLRKAFATSEYISATSAKLRSTVRFELAQLLKVVSTPP